jgi:hypothetical protein
MSNEAIYIMKLKNIPAFAGSESENNGSIKIICYVLTKAQIKFKLADISMFKTKLPAITP